MGLTTYAVEEHMMAGQEPTTDLPDIPLKTCTRCGETKPETAFSFH